MRILSGLEDGTMSAADSVELVEAADPALVYLLFTWLRRRYADHPAADAVVGRLVAVVDKHPKVSARMAEGKKDPVVEWFEDEHQYKDLSARDFVELIVDKLEG